MGKLTGDRKHYDEAVKQVAQFSRRMFNAQKGLYMHGWVEGMTGHPEFHWGRANGWGINRGWLDPLAYAPATLLGWNAVSTKVNATGQVEGVCVGTGMGFDPAFYYHRPINPYAAHGYGPVLLAGAEVINLLKRHTFEINDSSLQLVLKK